MNGIVIIFLSLFSLSSIAAEVKFGFFESPSQRVEKFKSSFPVGSRFSEAMSVGSMNIPLPAGDWVLVAASADIPVLNDLSKDSKSESVPHGRVMLVSADIIGENRPRKLLILRMPLGGFKNRTWLASVPNLCNPDWGGKSIIDRELLSLDQRSLDCRAISYAKIFSWNDFLINSGKVGLKYLGGSYGGKDNYLLSMILLSKNNSVFYAEYAELIDDGEYGDVSTFIKQHDNEIVGFRSTALMLNGKFKNAFDAM